MLIFALQVLPSPGDPPKAHSEGSRRKARIRTREIRVSLRGVARPAPEQEANPVERKVEVSSLTVVFHSLNMLPGIFHVSLGAFPLAEKMSTDYILHRIFSEGQ